MKDEIPSLCDPVRIPIEDVLDLHPFSPKEVPSLIEEYLLECHRSAIREVRLIHGKGQGYLWERVHSILRKSPLVESFHLADHTAGGWGATIVILKP